MFVKGDLRKETRIPYVTPVKYSVSGLTSRESKQIHNGAVTVDISPKGIGIITNYPLEKGHILTFENDIKTINITAKTAIVKWVGKVDSDKYRVGLQFV
jgi:hypothetical protein